MKRPWHISHNVMRFKQALAHRPNAYPRPSNPVAMRRKTSKRPCWASGALAPIKPRKRITSKRAIGLQADRSRFAGRRFEFSGQRYIVPPGQKKGLPSGVGATARNEARLWLANGRLVDGCVPRRLQVSRRGQRYPARATRIIGRPGAAVGARARIPA